MVIRSRLCHAAVRAKCYDTIDCADDHGKDHGQGTEKSLVSV